MATHCQVGQFRCTTGECIPIHLMCNLRADCPHGDDELHCKIRTLSCPRGQFSCHDGEKCFDHHQKCDGTVDCQDRSDEFSCFEQSTCRPGNTTLYLKSYYKILKCLFQSNVDFQLSELRFLIRKELDGNIKMASYYFSKWKYNYCDIK